MDDTPRDGPEGVAAPENDVREDAQPDPFLPEDGVHGSRETGVTDGASGHGDVDEDGGVGEERPRAADRDDDGHGDEDAGRGSNDHVEVPRHLGAGREDGEDDKARDDAASGPEPTVEDDDALPGGIDAAAGTPPTDAESSEADDADAGPPALLRCEDLSRSYGPVHALGPVDLKMDGQVLGLLGPNGAGKSTFIRLMLGVIGATTGTLDVLGQRVRAGNHALRQRIGYAPEGHARFPHLTGVEAVAFAGRLVGMSHGDAMQRAHQVLDYVELGEARYRSVENYSTGMRQRLKLAQALVHDPDLLILDEPTEGVDPQVRDHILGLIEELAAVHGIRVIVSTHLLSDVERLATHVLVLDEGRVVAHGPLEELQSVGQHGYVVRVAGDPKGLTDHLDAAGVAWRPMTPSIRVETDDPREVLRHVQAAGLVVRHLAPVRLRLEEAFEQAVGGGADA